MQAIPENGWISMVFVEIQFVKQCWPVMANGRLPDRELAHRFLRYVHSAGWRSGGRRLLTRIYPVGWLVMNHIAPSAKR